jgi:tetrapyrrole methylase family protein/MazG family protein
MDELDRFESLVTIMDRLRDPGGCPWDREQTYETLRGYLIEECYEVAEAIDLRDEDGLCEELGDLLFQIVFLARLGQEGGRFDAADVVRGIASKMIRRHPHVFGDETVESTDEVLRNWEAIKRSEKPNGREGAPASVLDGVPRALPALLKAQRLGTKAARVGFDWERPEAVLDKVAEELAELRQALGRQDRTAIGEEVGDLLFSAVMLARKCEVDPEAALEGTNRKFAVRFRWIEEQLRLEGSAVEDAGPERLDRLWQQSKSES